MHWVMRGLEIAAWVQFVTFAVHDTIPLGRWNNLSQFQRVIPLGRRVRGSVLNSVTAGAVLVLFWLGWMRGGETGGFFRVALLVTLGVLVYMEFRAWWRPYLFGATPAIIEKLRPNWEGTYAFLPERNGIKPNAMHCVMHAATVAGFGFALADHFMRLHAMHTQSIL
jgi:hypothetical protein